MIFTREEAQRIARGAKTVHLAPLVTDSLTGRPKPSWAQRYKVGEDLGVQPGAGESEICRVLVTDKAKLLLRDVDFQMVRRLGHKTSGDWARDLLDRHDPDYPPLDEEAICESCDGHAELEDGSPCENQECELGVVLVARSVGDDEALAWLRDRYGEREMWAVSFQLADGLRFLSDVVIAGKQGDYVTTSARGLRGEAPAVDEITQRRLTREAHDNDRDRDQARLERRIGELCVEFGFAITDQRARARIRDLFLTGQRRGAGRRRVA